MRKTESTKANSFPCQFPVFGGLKFKYKKCRGIFMEDHIPEIQDRSLVIQTRDTDIYLAFIGFLPKKCLYEACNRRYVVFAVCMHSCIVIRNTLQLE